MPKRPLPMLMYVDNPDDGGGTPPNAPEGGQEPPQTFSQADVDRIVKERVQRERAKFADYDDLKAKAGAAITAEERIANLEKEIASSRVEALRAKYAADVPEGLRPLLTASTDDDLKAQRDLILQGVSDRKKQGNRAPNEGGNPNPGDSKADERAFVRGLFGRAD